MKSDIYNDPISVVAKDNVENLIWIDLDTSKTVCEQIKYIRDFINSTNFNDYNVSIVGIVDFYNTKHIMVLDFLAQLTKPLTIWYRGILCTLVLFQLKKRFKTINFSKACLELGTNTVITDAFITEHELQTF
jgi:hypothetical protein